MTAKPSSPDSANTRLPALPLTVEGSAVLHQMFRVKWTDWRKLAESERRVTLEECVSALEPAEKSASSAAYSLLGHKGDLLLVHFRDSFDELNAAELQLQKLRIAAYLDIATSYVSVVELGLYDSSVKLYRELKQKGVAEHSEEWKQATRELLERQRDAMRPRLFPKIPAARYISFYPMDRRRGEQQNWYTLPIEERQRQMEEHGLVGRRYAGQVQQIITGSIGFDDWEWGVDLFADDPLIFKKLIYEMRFDEVSAVYALFGQFYLGIRCPLPKLGELFSGHLPAGRAT